MRRQSETAVRACAAMIILTVIASTPAVSAQTFKIGLINSYSGFLAQAGDQMQKGIDRASAKAASGPVCGLT
jgi:hypothetical protein